MSPSHCKTIEKREVQFANANFMPEVVALINEGHSVTINLRGISMRPFLEDNRDKAVLVKPTGIRIGDPVLAEPDRGFYVLHRVIKIEGENITLLGDGNPVSQREYCTLDDIRGTVRGFYRKGSHRMDSTTGLRWRLYSFFWMNTMPLRRYILYAYRKLTRQ